MDDRAKSYDEKYKIPNFFRDQFWLYRPFISAVVRKAALPPGATLLDAGCGQGFFTALFAEHGISALGVDLSSVGIQAARESYGGHWARFHVGDILQLSPGAEFDCVFTRSCSLYNNTSFPSDRAVTDRLLRYVRPGGVFIFDYYTRLAPGMRSERWLYHSIKAAREHFAKYPNHELYFSLRLEARLLGAHAFSSPVSRIAAFLGRMTGAGGEIVVFIRR